MKIKLYLSVLIISSSFFAQVSWEKLPGPFGGFYNSFTVGSQGYLMTSMNQNLYYLKDDKWNEVYIQELDSDIPNTISQSSIITQIEVSSSDFLILTGEAELLKSSDAGETWDKLYIVGDSAVSSHDKFLWDSSLGILYLKNFNKLFVSHDTAKTWTEQQLPVPDNWNSFTREIKIHSNSFLFYLTDKNLYLSDDFGYSWSILFTESNHVGGFYGFHIINDTKIALAGTQSYILELQDPKLRIVNKINKEFDVVAGDKFGNLYFASDEYLSEKVEYNIYKSDENGNNLQLFYKCSDRVSHMISYGEEMYLNIYRQGIYKSHNDSTFVSIGFGNAEILDFDYLIDGIMLCGIQGKKLQRSTDYGKSWCEIEYEGEQNYNNYGHLESTINGRTFFINMNNEIMKSQDYGLTWDLMSIYSTLNKPRYVNTFFLNKDTIFINDFPQKLLVFNDYGENWVMNKLGFEIVLDAAFGKNGEIFVAGMLQLLNNTLDYIDFARSFDSGNSWEFFNVAEYPIYSDNGNYLNRIAVNSDGVLFAGTDYLYRSFNNGDTWEQLDFGYDQSFINSLFIDKNDRIYIGIMYGPILISNDNGISWELFTEDSRIVGAEIFDTDELGRMYVGTFRDGLFRTTEPIVSVENDEFLETKSFTLNQNYPNPFNPTTTIQFSIPQTEKVILTAYNILGQKVNEIVNASYQAGTHKVEWNADNLSSGVYIIQLSAGKFYSTTKALLLK